MPRPRQQELNEATRREIKDIARALMAQKGTAGLSLRAIARKIGMTAPALYHYFPSLDDLITALVVDAFTGHAAYVQGACDAAANAGQSYAAQIFAGMLAYRAWALENSTDFQLIYGSPIPGYTAPEDVTTPAARSMGDVFMALVAAAVEAGEVVIPDAFGTPPPAVLDHYRTKYGMDAAAARLFHVMNQMWSVMHGMVTLEVYNHLPPVVGDTDAFYEQALRSQLEVYGVKIS